LAVRITGEQVPADPLQPLPVIDEEGRTFQIDIQSATVQMWSGIFGARQGSWIPAPAELLWAGTRVYVTPSGAATADPLPASRVRIVGSPLQARTQVVALENLTNAVEQETLMALLGSREQQGVYMLESVGTVQQLFLAEQSATWLSGDERAGLILRTPSLATGVNSFTWLRTDGSGLLIFAQPFYEITSVAGNLENGLWWVETPQADLNVWQLWHYDPAAAQIRLHLQAGGDFFRSAAGDASDSLAPVLLAASPTAPSAGETDAAPAENVTLLLDTLDRSTQQPHGGLFRLTLRTPTADESAAPNPTATDRVVASLELLLPADSYRGPLRVSPDGTKLGYFVYDAGQPSLTSGFITPANQLWLLALTGARSGETFLLYETETQFEFFAPELAWHGSDRLILVRSRFPAGDPFGLERFGLVEVRLPADAELGARTPETGIYLFPEGEALRDFAACRDGEYVLVVAVNEEGNLELGRWRGEARPRPLFGLPNSLSRVFACWRASEPAL
jgi:hypothetical protein